MLITAKPQQPLEALLSNRGSTVTWILKVKNKALFPNSLSRNVFTDSTARFSATFLDVTFLLFTHSFIHSFNFWLPQGIWSSQPRDHMWFAVVTYAAAVAIVDLLTHYAGPGIEPTSWHCRDAADPTVPQQKLLSYLFPCSSLLFPFLHWLKNSCDPNHLYSLLINCHSLRWEQIRLLFSKALCRWVKIEVEDLWLSVIFGPPLVFIWSKSYGWLYIFKKFLGGGDQTKKIIFGNTWELHEIQISVSINKVLLEHRCAHLFMHYLWLFHATTEFSSKYQDCLVSKLKIFSIQHFIESLPTPELEYKVGNSKTQTWRKYRPEGEMSHCLDSYIVHNQWLEFNILK